jgi:hypothetical protein
MTQVILTKGEVSELRKVVQDLADFPDLVVSFFVVYHTTDGRLMTLCRGNNASEIIGDIHRALHMFYDHITDFDVTSLADEPEEIDGETDEDKG